ncbi:hypothetical protein [Helicobacter rodentium]|nr:hypothetical protein [Helicobacter rodentium]
MLRSFHSLAMTRGKRKNKKQIPLMQNPAMTQWFFVKICYNNALKIKEI